MWNYQRTLCFIITVTVYPVQLNSHGQGIYAPGHDNYKPTDYSFSYGVKDYHTGDIKHQWEKKDGDKVTGHYSLVEADGSIRTVEYSADEHSGFNAIVKHTGSFKHPITHTNEEPVSHNEVILQQTYEKPEYNAGPKYEYKIKEPQYEVQYVYPQHGEELKYATETSNYQTEEDTDKDNYAVFNNHEESAEQSQHSLVRTKHRYRQQSPNAINSQLTIKEEYENIKLVPELPIDLSLIKGEPVQPVDVSVLNPVEINVKEPTNSKHKYNYSVKDTSVKPSHELTEEEIKKYLEDYYQQNSNVPHEPYINGGFKPVRNKPKGSITQPNIPGTYMTDKKPKTTPGLSSYNSNGSHHIRSTKRNPKLNRNHFQKSFIPVSHYHHFFPADEGLHEENQNTGVQNLYKSLLNNGYTRYARHIDYEV